LECIHEEHSVKVIAPGLKLDMILSDIALRNERPVIVCRVGAYDATTELSREDIATFLRCVLRPRVLLAFIRMLLSKRQAAP
jgi:hypothetical protein